MLMMVLVMFVCVKNDLYVNMRKLEVYKVVDVGCGIVCWVIEECVSVWNGVGAYVAKFFDEFGLRRV